MQNARQASRVRNNRANDTKLIRSNGNGYRTRFIARIQRDKS